MAPWAFIISFYFNETCLCECISIVFTVGGIVWQLWNIRNLTANYGCFFKVSHKHTHVNMIPNMFKLITLAWASEIFVCNDFTYMIQLRICWILAIIRFLIHFAQGYQKYKKYQNSIPAATIILQPYHRNDNNMQTKSFFMY